MKCLEANKRPFWYSLYVGTAPIMDGEYDTGEKTVVYAPPVRMLGNVSPATGNTIVELFGGNERYDKIIVLDLESAPPIDEYTVLCIDKDPTFRDGALEYDYVVKRVAKSLHYIFIATKKVTVS